MGRPVSVAARSGVRVSFRADCTFVENVAHVSACLGKLAASTPWCEVKHKYGVRPCPSLE